MVVLGVTCRVLPPVLSTRDWSWAEAVTRAGSRGRKSTRARTDMQAMFDFFHNWDGHYYNNLV